MHNGFLHLQALTVPTDTSVRVPTSQTMQSLQQLCTSIQAAAGAGSSRRRNPLQQLARDADGV